MTSSIPCAAFSLFSDRAKHERNESGTRELTAAFAFLYVAALIFPCAEAAAITADDQGNMFFTVPVQFSAFRLSPRGELTAFRKSGSAKGKFGVVAGIATDDMGYIYVSDRLRSVVLVFDRDLRFQTEFGYRGNQPSNLIVPDDLAVDSSGNVYVGQAANRGVSVFKVVHQEISPPQASESMSINHEQSDQAIEEVEVDRLEFVVDRGSDTASTDSGDSGRNTEAVESQHNEVNKDE